MLIIGAKGFAKEVLEICKKNNQLTKLAFFDDLSQNGPERLYDTFPILKSMEEAVRYFEEIDSSFSIGIGKPSLRKTMYDKFTANGGKLTSIISPDAKIGSYDIEIGEGANILDGVKISNSVNIGLASLIYYNAIITHDCNIGDFVEISPNATILGRVHIDSFTHIGANATILPNLKVGTNVLVGAGAVVTKDIPDNSIAVGVPAKFYSK